MRGLMGTVAKEVLFGCGVDDFRDPWEALSFELQQRWLQAADFTARVVNAPAWAEATSDAIEANVARERGSQGAS